MVNKKELRQFTSWLGKRSYQARLKRLGIERLQDIARENGKRGGRPRKPAGELSASGKYQRPRRG